MSFAVNLTLRACFKCFVTVLAAERPHLEDGLSNYLKVWNIFAVASDAAQWKFTSQSFVILNDFATRITLTKSLELLNGFMHEEYNKWRREGVNFTYIRVYSNVFLEQKMENYVAESKKEKTISLPEGYHSD